MISEQEELAAVEVVVVSAAEVVMVDKNHTLAVAAEDSGTEEHRVESGTAEASDRALRLDAVGDTQHAVDWRSTAEARAVKEQPWAKYPP